jgi:Tol biopolymer transport system component
MTVPYQSRRMIFPAATVAVLVAVACSGAQPPSAASNRPSATSRASSAAAASSGPALVTARAATVARDHRYVAASEGDRGHVLLIDLTTGTAVQVVSARGTTGRPYFLPPFSESADGRKLLVGATGPTARSALYLIDVPTGRVTLLYEDEEIWAVGPLRGVLSPDGERYALHGHDGVRIGDTSGGATSLFVADEDPADMAKIWYPLSWSADRTAIALAQGTDTVTRVATFHVANGEEYWSGAGSQVSWRAKTPFLAIAGSAGTFGGENRVYVVDPNVGEVRDVEPLAAKYFGSIAWHPSADRVLYTVADSQFAESDAYTRTLGEDASKRVDSPRKIWDAWWSSDGSRIYATAPRGTDTGAPRVGDFDILELPGGRVVASVCGSDGHCR